MAETRRDYRNVIRIYKHFSKYQSTHKYLICFIALPVIAEKAGDPLFHLKAFPVRVLAALAAAGPCPAKVAHDELHLSAGPGVA